MNKIVYLPIEIKSRDFNNKLLLSYFLTLKGFQVFLGRKKEIETLAKNFTPGIYFGVNTQKNYIKFYSQIKAKNHKILLFDEEGLVTLPYKTYVKVKASKEIISVSDIFFCWGNKQLNKILTQKKVDKRKLILSGSLRIELLKKKYDELFKSKVNQLKKKYKNLNLFISCYGFSNHYLKEKNDLKDIIKLNSLNRNLDIQNYKNYIDFNKKRFVNYINNLKRVKDDSAGQIIIRPHPSENQKYYSNILENKKIKVSSKFTVVEWIKAAKVIVHDYCTTSFEASILKKKIFHFPLNLKNLKLDKDIYRISNSFNNKIKFFKKNKDKILKEHVHNYKNISAIKIICNIFDELEIKNQDSKAKKKYLKSKLLLKYFSLRNDAYTDFKTPFIKEDECLKFLKKIEKIEKKKIKLKLRNLLKI